MGAGASSGLSPRVRGNHGGRDLECGGRRSIPAGAGEPRAAFQPLLLAGVYPRGCGGTSFYGASLKYVTGLSPRVRGNQPQRTKREGLNRSIPAGAGEPFRPPVSLSKGRVYPRGCGGTPPNERHVTSFWGLSPRVRGNHLDDITGGGGKRSIPAGAGEPVTFGTSAGNRRVYPRGCGGTAWAAVYNSWKTGLSPRVRGNPYFSVCHCLAVRSIPAGAGEPYLGHISLCGSAVYPRGCGGTTDADRLHLLASGLSPRVRGNPTGAWADTQHLRSIPAGAGEPLLCGPCNGLQPVYPRGCGGTMVGVTALSHERGLSPRVRGNLERVLRVLPFARSIPAGAGEPMAMQGCL